MKFSALKIFVSSLLVVLTAHTTAFAHNPENISKREALSNIENQVNIFFSALNSISYYGAPQSNPCPNTDGSCYLPN